MCATGNGRFRACPLTPFSIRKGLLRSWQPGNLEPNGEDTSKFALSTYAFVTVARWKQVLMSEFSSNNTFVVASLHLLRYSDKAKFGGGVVTARR